jgi:hypothetical protein
VFVDVLLGLALADWATAFYSLVRVEPLLGGTGTEDHRRAVAHMRRVHLAALAFVMACIAIVLAGILSDGIRRGPSLFDRPPTVRAG